MQLTALLLVLASAALHAWWNFLLKRSGGGTRFLGLSKVAEAAIFLPAFAVVALPGVRPHLGAWPLVLGGAALSLANYAALSRAYRLGDLAVVYPVARGAMLLFLPALGFLALGERVSPAGGVALGAIVAGVLVVQLPGLSARAVRGFARRAAEPAIAFALLAGLAGAGYTIWDKRAVQTLPAFTYLYAYNTLVGVAYGLVLLREPAGAVRAEWRANRSAIVQVALGNTVAYLLVLAALRGGTSSYVIAVRQLSVVLGALLGWRLLGEGFGAPRRLGVALIVAGCVILAMTR